ncbi:acylphosphatase [bacterium]|nr:acylphosphatase [bacterium]
MKEQARLVISGKVQGVFYRDYACEKARDLDVYGWIRNNSDGTVEVFCQGNATNVQMFIDWCYQGPISAKVTEIDIQKQPLEGEELFDSFDVKY